MQVNQAVQTSGIPNGNSKDSPCCTNAASIDSHLWVGKTADIRQVSLLGTVCWYGGRIAKIIAMWGKYTGPPILRQVTHVRVRSRGKAGKM